MVGKEYVRAMGEFLTNDSAGSSRCQLVISEARIQCWPDTHLGGS
jgi:hypothetical protein